MPTLNPRLKVSTRCVRDLSKYRHEAPTYQKKESTVRRKDGIVGTGQSSSNSNKDTTFVRSMQYDDYLLRKVNNLRTHVGSSYVQRNASDTSLLWTLGGDDDDEIESCGKESSTKMDLLTKQFSNTPDRVVDPSLVAGNLRNVGVKSAFQIMEEFLSQSSVASVEPTQDNSGRRESKGVVGGGTDFLKISQVKAKNKPARFTPSKQEINKQKERMNSSLMENNTSKPCNIYSRSLPSGKLGRVCRAVEDRVPHVKGFQIQSKVRSDLSVNITPYLKKSKVHLSPYQSNSSAPRIKNFNRTANSFQRLARRKVLPGDEQIELKKVYLTKIRSDGGDGVSSEQSSTKQDRQSSNESGSVSADIKPAKTKHPKPKSEKTHQTSKPEIKASQRERMNSEENKLKTLSKVLRYEMKKQQRQEIYALNKVMTDLENERFILFMQEVRPSSPGV